ncbi:MULTISPECIES: phenylacetate--CoA ligase [Thermodesulfobacterium]|uniref:Phenylacetate-coenzyme A ligase n=1 Tax=Thermodesulfobacterium commune DSM 2178 TaxID=289377 RepID=A0A075X124_9BACT|nr:MULTISPECIES: phenylacetate--CoA ligase [Thermodesulfobacterium]AIH04692.1 phenylacetate--CoA ligase [Thermodesulfobacterium commune DSM 2178]MBZ4681284.1 phenylacetate--CoA ligase [Thermodesulfobacterium sp.]HBT04491.1 phenylacetate--CoA ligase family protein [Thermodesulfobacterium commune]HCP10296.1 phenylacetate--CoA ligase family protein [Thermodesulfobacterium commune]
MFWDQQLECIDQEKLREIQLQRLKEVVRRVYEKVPFYRKKFDEAGIKPEDIRSLEDIKYLPFTSKTDMREAYPFGLFAVPLSEIVEIHTSSGTTGKPVVAGYTVKDIALWAEVMARCLVMVGATKDDIVQIAYGYGMFTGGLGFHYGAQKIGATVVPASAGNTRRQIELMKDFGTTFLACTPSYALYLTEYAKEEMGIDLSTLKLRIGSFGAEMWTEEMRKEIERRMGIKAYNVYGLTEIIGPGVAHECPAQQGLHVWEDHFYPEIIDPETGEPLPEGQEGELVLTSLTREGMPMIRFRTRDITTLHREKCACGRTLAKIERIKGRSDDMIKVRGVMIFPYQIEQAILEVQGVEPHYQIILTRPHYLDEVEVQVEMSKEIFSDDVKTIETLRKRLEKKIEQTVGVRVKVTLVEPKSIPRSEGKAKRIIDKRNLK